MAAGPRTKEVARSFADAHPRKHKPTTTQESTTEARTYVCPVLLDTVYEHRTVSSMPFPHRIGPEAPHSPMMTGLGGSPSTGMPPLRVVHIEGSSPQGTVHEMSPATTVLSRTATYTQSPPQSVFQSSSPTTPSLSRGTTFANTSRQNTTLSSVTALKKTPKVLGTTVSEETIQVMADGESFRSKGASRQAHWLGNWWQEIVSSIVSMACLGVIVVVLKMFENVSITKWSLPITINSMLAVSTAFMKACLVFPVAESIGQTKWFRFSSDVRSMSELVHFDLATRGPWGCVTLLFGQLFRPTRSYFATLGAIITIAAVALDPFSQSLISLYRCEQPLLSGTALIPRINVYTGGELKPLDEMWIPEAATTDGNLRESMQSAMYIGLVKPPDNSSASVETFCSTGNCTFAADATKAVFQTLSMCHSCRDISDQIIEDSPIGNHTLPSGAVANDRDLFSCAAEPSFRADDPIFKFECVMRNDYSLGLPVPTAISCQLFPCVKTYAAGIRNSQYTETILSTETPNPGNAAVHKDSLALIISAAVIDPLRAGVRKKCESASTPSASHTVAFGEVEVIKTIRDNITQGLDYQRWYEPECIWGFEVQSQWGFSSFLADKINLHKLGLPLSSGEPWLRKAFQNGNGSVATFDEVVGGLALTISGQMRSENVTAEFSTRPVEGTAWENDTCIGVQWQWISFPVSLLMLEILLLLATIDRGRRCDWRGDWKSSPLPLLFNAPLHDGDIGAAKSLTVAEMEERASLLRIKMVQDPHECPSEGWRLQKITELPTREKWFWKDRKGFEENQHPSTMVEQHEVSEDEMQPRGEVRRNAIPPGPQWV